MQKRRVSTFRIDSAQRTDQGALKVKANLTKTGVFDYALPSGQKVREYRSPEEVFRQEALDTLHGSPVTLLHPSEFVTTGNWDLLAVGNVISVEANDPYVSGTILIHDSRVIEKIEKGELKEISCGYSADIVPAPDGETRFDAMQVGLNYNHAAIGPAEWGRLGSDVALRLDAESQIILEDFRDMDKQDKTETAEERVDEKTPEEDVVEETQEATEIEDSEDAFDLKAAFADITVKFDEVLKRLDSLTPEEETAEEAEEKTDAQDEIDAIVEARVAETLKVRSAHAKLCPEIKQDGKTNVELCVEGLKAVEVNPEGHDEKSLVAMLETAAIAKGEPAKVEDSKPSFADRLRKGNTQTSEETFANRLVASVS